MLLIDKDNNLETRKREQDNKILFWLILKVSFFAQTTHTGKASHALSCINNTFSKLVF